MDIYSKFVPFYTLAYIHIRLFVCVLCHPLLQLAHSNVPKHILSDIPKSLSRKTDKYSLNRRVNSRHPTNTSTTSKLSLFTRKGVKSPKTSDNR